MSEREPTLHTNKRSEYLRKVFDKYLTPELESSNSPRILSLACGFGYEARAFLGKYPKASYLGIDIDPVKIAAAKKVNNDLIAKGEDVAFELKDATKMEAFGKKDWNIIYIEQPQLLGGRKGWGGIKPWEAIITNAMDSLGERGTLFFLADLSDEREEIKLILEKGKVPIITNEENELAKHGEGIITPGIYVMAAKKL